jgi:hypothetical protein
MPGAINVRHVFYCPGYDAAADSRYRRLFVEEFARLAERFAVERDIGPVQQNEAVPSMRWAVAAGNGEWRTETIYEVLRWEDLIRRDLNRTWVKRGPLLLKGIAAAFRERTIFRLFRIDRHFAAGLFYPHFALLGLIVAALLVAYGATSLVDLVLPLSNVTTGIITVGFVVVLVRAAQPLLRQAYVYHLMDDWIFNRQNALGKRPDFDARLDQFARRIVAAVLEGDAQEILVVGHSTGVIVAIEVLTRALALDPQLNQHGPSLAVLTIGSRVPGAALWNGAYRLRETIARLATDPTVLWVEYQAPQDFLNAFRFDPVRDLRLDLGARTRTGPVIRSPRFKEILLPRTYRRRRWNLFRMHFQFLMANEIPGEYDYLMITCGPVSLADRIANPQAAVDRAYGTADQSRRCTVIGSESPGRNVSRQTGSTTAPAASCSRTL